MNYDFADRLTLAIAGAWAVWAMSWILAAAWSRRTAARPGFGREFPNRFVTVVGGVLLFKSLGSPHTLFPFTWSFSEPARWVLFAFVLTGMAFAWWARIHLGTLWSGTVTRKEGHRIIDTGPYAVVRHPIYTGIIFSLFATAAERGHIEPVIGAALMAIGFWMKAKLEEGFLAEDLGPQYAAYRERVPMLVPFIGARG